MHCNAVLLLPWLKYHSQPQLLWAAHKQYALALLAIQRLHHCLGAPYQPALKQATAAQQYRLSSRQLDSSTAPSLPYSGFTTASARPISLQAAAAAQECHLSRQVEEATGQQGSDGVAGQFSNCGHLSCMCSFPLNLKATGRSFTVLIIAHVLHKCR
jgi:hypothetical protein